MLADTCIKSPAHLISKASDDGMYFSAIQNINKYENASLSNTDYGLSSEQYGGD